MSVLNFTATIVNQKMLFVEIRTARTNVIVKMGLLCTTEVVMVYAITIKNEQLSMV
jgi:hypothetical protein